MNDTWKYRTKHSLGMVSAASQLLLQSLKRFQVQAMIAHLPAVGVRRLVEGGGGELVSWALTYRYGAMGMLFTLPVTACSVLTLFADTVTATGPSQERTGPAGCAPPRGRVCGALAAIRVHRAGQLRLAAAVRPPGLQQMRGRAVGGPEGTERFRERYFVNHAYVLRCKCCKSVSSRQVYYITVQYSTVPSARGSGRRS